MTRRSAPALVAATVCVAFAAVVWTDTPRTLDVYSIDVEGGGATLFVSPSGQSLLVDAGNPGARDADRIAATVKAAGLSQIDYLVISHFHADHGGGVADLAARVPMGTFVDHGAAVHDGSAFRLADRMFQTYLDARAKGRPIEVKPGDSVPVRGLDVKVVSSDGALTTRSLAGEAAANPLCRQFLPREEDLSENARSVGVVVSYGRFRVLDLGDLTWNKEHALVCPNNLLGQIDAYVTTHHGLNLSGPPALVHAVRPRVAIMNNGPRKGASREAWTTIRTSPGLVDLWQLHYAVRRPGNPAFHERSESGGEEFNVPEPFIANLDENASHAPAYSLKVSARRDGSFSVTNARNGFTKAYRTRQ